LYTNTIKPRIYRGVQCSALNAARREATANLDAFIVCNAPAENCLLLRPKLPSRCRLILWTGHAPDQSAMSALQKAEVRAGWDLIVCVSQWHAREMQRSFSLDSARMAVMRNAVGPGFENLFPDAAALAKAKSSAPVLAYTSTPFRGLNVLLSLFPEVRRREPRARLQVYSSMKVYGYDESKDRGAALYAQCRSTPGVEYVGSVPQPLLAESLKSAAILAYPNIFPETSCIAIMEAMAAGLLVVTTDLGALPETTMGLGTMVPAHRKGEDLRAFMAAYLDRLMEAIEDWNSEKFYSARWEQVRAVTSQCTWSIRAAEWERALREKVEQ
jgi:glycosyltransferase involved in cell wall biosynthesis